MKHVLSILALVCALTSPTAVSAAIIVFDTSGSMWVHIDSQTNLATAQGTLGEVLGEVPDGLQLGLPASGHREQGNCANLASMVSRAPASGDAMAVRANL